MAEIMDIMTFDFTKVADLIVTADTYQPVSEIITPIRVAGIYLYSIAWNYDYSTVQRSSYFRFSGDGGTHWSEIVTEQSDVSNKVSRYYAFPKIITTDQILQLKFEARCEQAGDTLNIYFSDVMIQRVN